MVTHEELQRLTRKSSTRGLRLFTPPSKCLYLGEECFAHTYSDETASSSPGMILVCDTDNLAHGKINLVPPQEITFPVHEPVL